jgi:uncharacterized membrane protein
MLTLAANTNTGLYKALLVAHLIVSIVGFGGVMLNGAYGFQTKRRRGEAALAVSEANVAVSMIAEKIIYLVPVFGVLLVLASGDAWGFDQTWVWLALVIYAAALAVSHGLLIPAHRRRNVLMGELVESPPVPGAPAPQQVARIGELAKREAMLGQLLAVALVVVVALMVWKPGA